VPLKKSIFLSYFLKIQKNEAFTNALSGFIQCGLPVSVCSGTVAWSNLAGNPEIAINNGISAAKCMRKNSGVGVTTAHWSSHPSMTHGTFAWPGFVLGAGLGWNSNIPESYVKSALPDLLDVHVFGNCPIFLKTSKITFFELRRIALSSVE
jgi:hypothetical protein